jgi:hypothetical protein
MPSCCHSSQCTQVTTLQEKQLTCGLRAGRHWQLWHRRAPQDAEKKLKRRQKRQRAKAEKLAADAAAAGVAPPVDTPAADVLRLAAQDEWEGVSVWRPAAATRAFALLPPRGAGSRCRVAALLADNSMAVATVSEVRRLRVHCIMHKALVVRPLAILLRA